MKKIGLLSLALIALQNISVAQTSFDANIGTGAWLVAPKPVVVEDHILWNPGCATVNSLGFGMKTVLDGGLTLGLGVKGYYMNQNSGYRTTLKCKGPDHCDFCDEFDGEGVFVNWDEHDGVGDKTVGRKEASTDYAMVAVPLKIGVQIGKFNPNIGVEYNYRVGIDKNVGELHSLGFTTGMRFDFNDRFAISTDFYNGITSDMSHTGTVYSGMRGDEDAEKIEIRDFKWKSYRLEFSFHYKFGGSSAN